MIDFPRDELRLFVKEYLCRGTSGLVNRISIVKGVGEMRNQGAHQIPRRCQCGLQLYRRLKECFEGSILLASPAQVMNDSQQQLCELFQRWIILESKGLRDLWQRDGREPLGREDWRLILILILLLFLLLLLLPVSRVRVRVMPLRIAVKRLDAGFDGKPGTPAVVTVQLRSPSAAKVERVEQNDVGNLRQDGGEGTCGITSTGKVGIGG
mmetsp:Transcript_2601/g.5545  ORF Transcript_2601/g.5545 Transcript_2601/m.5545 type:complete len:210 (+) Transcript_2601:530-1159(+)